MKKGLRMGVVIISPALASCGSNGGAGTNNAGATLTSLAVTPANPSIARGTTKQFTVTGTYSDNTTRDVTSSVTWSSSDATKATINTAGLATGQNVGSATITATSGSISGVTTLTVTSATLVSIAITPTNSSVAKGTAQQFTATGTFSDNSVQDLTTQVAWTSSDTIKATVTNAGLATGTGIGSSTITAASGGISGSTTLTVTSATLVSISVTPTNPSITLGTAQQFTATGTYTDNSIQDITSSVTWRSSDTNIAAISNANGLSNYLTNGTGITIGSSSISFNNVTLTGDHNTSSTLTLNGRLNF